ncbi:Pyrimidine-nucleoside phosphorylase [Acidisarcina polymorpha]|uniref:thymidine phosphorylase n=1 Tax=Acidisarcina polymorpha TaxID=2211140 RepID=A0A2Z5G6P3_9BACT|nr:thymidine phosphorylase [Acidisarcina polymorpha]AXC14640.1 Pyrimidine-nucleoside phosphorylase [Acidisarcina polymorpha]
MADPAQPIHHHIIDIIRKKRDGHELNAPEIEFVVNAAARHSDPDATQPATEAQLAAWLMTVLLRGLTAAELHALTKAMRFSGEVFDPSPLGKFAIDKHSTGGVGDSTSFIVAPIAAAAGLSVPMISGRALGHTGGTLDKLDSIPGYRSNLSLAEMFRALEQNGAFIVSQTKALVPADRVLYALRDHTGTVESPYLICASIMSKKLAAGLNGLVLDVKTGSGAFLKSEEEGLYLASLMVRTGEASGTRTVAVLTDMNQPLGRFAGNWVEIWEAVDVLSGKRHPLCEDILQISLTLAGWMLHLGDKAPTPAAGYDLAQDLLTSGAALTKFKQMIAAQGGDAGVFDDPGAFHTPAATKTIFARSSGYLSAIDTEKVGWAVQRLGAGREKAAEPVDAYAGIEMHVKLGDHIEPGQPLITMFAADPERLAEPEALLYEAIAIADEPSTVPRLIYECVTVENADRFSIP